MAYANEHLKVGGSIIDRIVAALNAWRAERREDAAKNAVYRDTLLELNSLSRRDLDDIGLRASDIETIAREAAYGK